MATTEWIEDIEGFRKIAPLWDETLDASSEANPFLLSDFLLTWWKHNAAGRALRIYCRFSEGRLVAGVPLCLEPGRGRRVLAHMGDYAANVTHFLSDGSESSVTEPFLDALAARKDWDFCRFNRVLCGSRTWAGFSSQSVAFARPLFLQVQDVGHNSRVSLVKGYAAVIRGLSPRTRRALKYCSREAEKLGPLRLVPAAGAGAAASLFEDYRRLSIESFRRRGRRSSLERPEPASFLRELMIVFDSRGRLQAHRLMAGERLLAVSVGYRYRPGFKWILTAFDHSHADLSPGHLLIDALVKEAEGNGDPYFDMYYGDSPYKMRWCDELIPLRQVTLGRDSVLNRVLALLQRFRGWAYRKRHPLPPPRTRGRS